MYGLTKHCTFRQIVRFARAGRRGVTRAVSGGES
jgi:hypothetical protein